MSSFVVRLNALVPLRLLAFPFFRRDPPHVGHRRAEDAAGVGVDVCHGFWRWQRRQPVVAVGSSGRSMRPAQRLLSSFLPEAQPVAGLSCFDNRCGSPALGCADYTFLPALQP